MGSLKKGKSYISMININDTNNDIMSINDPDYVSEDESIPNSEIDLLGTDSKDRIDIIASNTTGFYVSGNDGIFLNIQYITEKNNKSTSICQLIQSFSLPKKTTRIRAISLSRYKEFMFALTDNNQILKVNVELGSTEVNIVL